MKPKFWFSADSQYDGPFASLKEAKDAAVKACKPDEAIEIHQCVYTSPVPARDWVKA